jgi:lipopolysaccharide transport system permease protein
VPVILVTYVMIVACSFLGACLVCVARDFNNLIALGMMFLMFTSGIFWDVRGLSDPAKTELIMAINPVAFMVDCYRQIMISDIRPDMVQVFTIGAVFGAILCVMVLLMRRGSQYLALKVITA